MPKTKEQCDEIKRKAKQNILNKSLIYFARNGFAGTKISDLAKHIGIAQGTLYMYFESKEALFQEVQESIKAESSLKQMELLTKQSLSAKRKIKMLSKNIIKKLKEDKNFAASVAINTQAELENSGKRSSSQTTYQLELYKNTMEIIKQGQKEGTVVDGSLSKLADYYWGVVYLYALKIVFTTEFEMIEPDDLDRTLLKK